MIRLPFRRLIRRIPEDSILPVYLATLLLIFHASTIVYINSSYLSQFIDESSIGTIYTLGSALSVLIFLFISRVLHRVGNYKMTVSLLILNMLAVGGMAFASELRVAVPLFIIHLITVPLIFFNLDVFMEEKIGNNEGSTGSKRGLLLTLCSIVAAISPLASSVIVDLSRGDFTYSYLLSAAILLPIMVIMFRRFKHFSDPAYDEIDIFSNIRTFWENLNIRYVFLAHFSLQLFFMIMVIYTPIYLITNIGLSWTELGITIFFAKLAYVFLEYPVGLIADKYIGEKEMMGFGFLIMIISTSWMSFVTVPSVVVWSIIAFVTRIGASFVEATTESYFFKQTKSNDAQIISFFRITRPLSYVVGAMLAGLCLLYLPFNMLFIMLAITLIPPMFMTINIEDSK